MPTSFLVISYAPIGSNQEIDYMNAIVEGHYSTRLQATDSAKQLQVKDSKGGGNNVFGVCPTHW